MRLVAVVTDPDIRRRSGFVRMMIVTNPAQPWVEPGQGVLFTYTDADDGPCCCQWPLTDLVFAKPFIRRKYKIPARAWRPVPDQLAGCLDDWLGPVRLSRSAVGAAPLWERHEAGRWVGSMVPRRRSLTPRPEGTPPQELSAGSKGEVLPGTVIPPRACRESFGDGGRADVWH